MSNSENKKKQKRTVLEGFNNVPKLLEEARQAVDEVNQGVQSQGAVETKKTPRGRKTSSKKAVPRKTSGTGVSRQKKPARSPAPPAQEAAHTIPPPAVNLEKPLLGLRDCGITVKHALPGRIRLRLYKMLHNEALATDLPALLTDVPGVTSAEASSATGSLLITFNTGDMAALQARRKLAGVMHRFFPRLDTESLTKRMLGE